MSYYWTTKQDLGSSLQITEGGYYESIDRETGRLKQGVNGINPSSNIPELCVSGTPNSSLFAKIQSSRLDGEYYIYKTEEEPDITAPRSSLDFEVLDEYRYNMDKNDYVKFKKYKSVNIPQIVVDDIEFAYEYSQPKSVNHNIAENIKSNLNKIIYNSGTYPTDLQDREEQRRYEELSDAYGEEYAKEVLDRDE